MFSDCSENIIGQSPPFVLFTKACISGSKRCNKNYSPKGCGKSFVSTSFIPYIIE